MDRIIHLLLLYTKYKNIWGHLFDSNREKSVDRLGSQSSHNGGKMSLPWSVGESPP